MEELNLEIASNFDINDTTGIVQDTQARIDKIFDVNPIKPIENPGASLPDTRGPEYNPNLTNDVMSKIMKQMPSTFNSGVGEKVTAKYDQGRYSQDSFGYKFGADNEDRFATEYNTGFWGVTKGIGKMLGRFALGTVAKVGEGVGYIGSMFGSIGSDDYFLSVADNQFSRAFEKFEDKIKQDWMPVYQEASARNAGFWKRMFTDSTFWTNDFADGAAFMASAFVPGMALSKLGLGARMMALLGKGAQVTEAISIVENAALKGTEAYAKATNYLVNAQRMASAIDNFSITALNTASESMFEASGVAKSVMANLNGKINPKTGLVYTDQEKRQAANEAAKGTFWANAVALSASNAWETKFLNSFLSKENRLTRAINRIDSEGQGLGSRLVAHTPTSRFEKFWASKPMQVVTALGTGATIEGLYEENVQLAIQRYNDGTFARKNKGFWKGWVDQTIDAISGNDTEAAMNIGIGALMGAPMSGAMAYREASAKNRNTQGYIDRVNAAKDAWLKINDLYEREPSTKDAQGNEVPGNIIFQNGVPKVNQEKALAVFNEINSKDADLKDIQEATTAMDPTLNEYLKKQLFADYFFAAKDIDKGDYVMDQLRSFKSKNTKNDLASVGVFDEKGISSYISLAEKLNTLHDTIENDVLVKNWQNSAKRGDDKIQHLRKLHLRSLGAQMLIGDQALEDVTSKLNALQIKLDSKYNTSFNEGIVNSLNELSAKIELQSQYLRGIQNSLDNTDTYDAVSTADVASAEKVLDEYKKEKEKLLEDNKEAFKKPQENKDPNAPIENQSYITEKDGEYSVSDTTDKTKDPEYSKYIRLRLAKLNYETKRRTDLEKWYSYANQKDGFENYKDKYERENKLSEKLQEEAKQEAAADASQHAPTGKTVTYEVKTSNGQTVEVTLQEGGVYLGPKFNKKVVDKNGKTLDAFYNVKVKVMSIDGDNILLLINDEELVTYKVSELPELGRLTDYNSLTKIQQFKIKYQNKAFFYSVPWKGPKGEKFRIVRARIDLDKTGTKLVVKYKDENGKVRYVPFNKKYLRDKNGKWSNSLAKVMALDLDKFTPEEEFLLEQDELARKQAIEDQIRVLSELVNEKVKQAATAKDRIQAINDRIEEVEVELEIEKERLEKILKDVKNVKSVKNARYLREQMQKEAAKIRKHIQDLEAIKVDLQVEHDTQKQIIAIAESIEEYYTEYGFNMIDNNDPIIDFQQKLEDVSSEYMNLYPDKTPEGLDPIEIMFAQANQELKDLQTKINKLDDYIEHLREILANYDKGLADPNLDIQFWADSFRDSLAERQALLDKFKNVRDEINLFSQPIMESRLVSNLANLYLPILTQRVYDDKVQKAQTNVTTPTGELIPMAILDGQPPTDKEDAIFDEDAKPGFTLNLFYKTFMRHYQSQTPEQRAAGMPQELSKNAWARRFFKFTSTVNLANGNYALQVITKANDSWGIRYDDTAINLVVVKKDENNEYKPVDISGNILENPTKDNLIYTTMWYAIEDVYKQAGLQQAYEEVKKSFTLDKKDPKETDEQLEARVKAEIPAYVETRKRIIEASESGRTLFFPITSKSGGIEVKEPRQSDGLFPQEALEGRVTIENPSPSDWQDIDLKVATAGTDNWQTGSRSVRLGIDGRLAEGRMAIALPNGLHARVYNRKFTDEEIDNLSDAILTYATLFYQEDLTQEEEATKNRLANYLENVLFWSVPVNTKIKRERDGEVSPKRVWFGARSELSKFEKLNPKIYDNMHRFDIPGLHIGNARHALTSLNKDSLRLLIKDNLAYHQVTNHTLKNNNKFYVPVFKNNTLEWDEFASYKEYLMSSRGGTRKAPLYVNIVKQSNSEMQPQFKSVYLRYSVPEELRVKSNIPAAASPITPQGTTPKDSTQYKKGDKIPDLASIGNGQTVLIIATLKGAQGLRSEAIVTRSGNGLITKSIKILKPDNTYFEWDPNSEAVYVENISEMWNRVGNVNNPNLSGFSPKSYEIFAQDSGTTTPTTTTPVSTTPEVKATEVAPVKKILSVEEILATAAKQAEAKKTEDEKKEDQDDDVPYRLALSNDPKYKDNIDEIKKFFAENLPQIPLKIVDYIIDNKAWGVFDNGVVKIFNQAGYGTGFHEAFEAVWNTLLMKEERNSLIDEFKSRKGQFTNPFTKETKNYSDASLYDVRETLAEEFADFMDKEGKDIQKDKPKRNNIFLRLWKRLLAFLKIAPRKKDELFNTIDKLYRAIPSGKFKNEIPTSYEGKHYAAIKDLNQQQTSLLLEGLHAYFFTNLAKKGPDKEPVSIESILNGTPNQTIIDSILSRAYEDLNTAITKEINRINKTGGFTSEQEALFIPVLLKLQNKEEFKSDIVSKYRDYLKKYKIIMEPSGKVQEDPDKDNPEEQTLRKEDEVKDNLGIQESMFVDTRSMASASVRLMLASLPNMTYNKHKKGYEFNRNELGFPRVNDYGKLINILTNDLQGITETSKNGDYVSRLDNMFRTLDSKYKVDGGYKSGFEWIAMLKKRLGIEELNGKPIDFNSISEDDMTLRIAFEKSFANTKIDPSKLVVSPDNVFIERNPLIASSEEQMRQNWLNNAKVYSKAGLQTYTIEGTSLIVNKNFLLEEYGSVTHNTPEQLITYLALLGIEIKTEFDKIVPGSFYYKTISEAVSSIVKTIQDATKADIALTFNDLFGRELINGSLKKLIAMELLNSSEDTSLQWLNPEGKTVYSITLPSYWSNVLNSLKSVDNIRDFIILNPQFGKVNEHGVVELKTYQVKSKFLELGGLVFDKNGNKRNDIPYTLLSGMANSTETYGENTSDLTFVDKLSLKMYYNLAGVYQTIINSDKSNEYGIGLGNLVSYDEVSHLNKAIEDHFLPYLEDELNCAIKSATEEIKIQYYNDPKIGVTKLGHFRNIINNSKDIINDILKGIRPATDIYSDSTGLIFDDIRTYLENQVTKNLTKYFDLGFFERKGQEYSSMFLSAEQLAKLNLDPKSMTEPQVRNLLMYVNFNEQVSSIEQHKLIYGHPALYKDLAKRSSGANSTKESIVEDRAILERLDREDPRIDGRKRNDREGYKMKVISYKDVIAVQKDAQTIAEKLFIAYSKSESMSKSDIEKAIGAKFTDNGRLLKFTEGGAMAAYLELNEADAQAYIMPDYYKDLLRLTAKLSVKQKSQLEYEAAYERLVRSGTIQSPKTNKTYKEGDLIYKPYSNMQLHKETTDSKNQLEKDMEVYEKGSPGAILPTLKPQYFGPQENDKLLHTTFLKHSVQPKTFREAEGTNFEKLYIAAQKNGIDIIGFESGEKVGNVEIGPKEFKALYDDRGDINVDNNNLPPIQSLYSKYYGIQVEMAGAVKDKVRRGSQMTKLILANLMMKGVAITDNVRSNIKSYIDTLDNLIDLGMEELKNELGITEDEDGNYVIRNVSKLIEAIKGEVTARELPDNIIESLGIDPNDPSKPLYKFDTLPIREKIDNILNSMADKRVVSQKMNGKAAAQVSSAMTENSNREWVYLKDGVYQKATNINQLSKEERKTLRLTSNDLAFYENGTMEILIPNYLEDYLPKGTEFNLKNVDPEVLRLIGFRIPTQSMGQIENIVIKGFLPKELGDIVVVPTAIVGKAGSDFDIDKLNLLMPNFYVDKDNKIRYINPNLEGNELLEVLEQTKYSHHQLRRKMLENKLIAQMADLLELPENFRQLISPNAAETLKALRGEKNRLTGRGKEELDPTGLSEFLKMAEIRERYVSSKVLVGIGAVHITSHTISQLGDIKLEGTYLDTNENVRKDIVVRLKASKKKDGKYSLALIENAEGVLITDLLSEAMTGFVDAAKDPFVFELNFNKDTAATWFYLLKLGVPLDQVAFFHTQPIIEEYIMYKQANSSLIRKLNERVNEGSTLTNNQLKAKTLDKYFGVFFGKGLLNAALSSKKAFNGLFSKIDKELTSYREANPIMSTRDMKEDIRNLSNKDHRITKEEAIRQIAVLLDFLQYTEQANYLTGFVNSIGYDTARTKSLVENKLQSFSWLKVKKDNFIENPDDALDTTFLRNLKNKRESLMDIFKNFFVILSDKSEKALEMIENKIQGREFADKFIADGDAYDPVHEKLRVSKDSQVEILNRFQSFFVNYILGTTKVATGNGRELQINKHYSLFRDTPNRKSLAKQLMDIKQEFPNNQAVQELYSIINSDSGGTDNIKLFGTKMSTYENNVIIESLQDLYRYAQESGDKKTERFVKDLTMFAMMQSGVQISPISYTKALPTSLYSDLAALMINKYSETDHAIDPYLVFKQFHQNNWKNSDIVPRVYNIAKNVITFGDEVPVVAIQPNTPNARYLNNRFFLNQWLKTRDKKLQEEMRKNKEDLYNYQLYEYSHFDEDQQAHIYKPINRLGNGMYHVEVYDRDTSGMTIHELPNVSIYGYIDEKTSTKQTLNINSDSSISSRDNSTFVSRMYTPENLTSLDSNGIFVFGSNTEGRHGKGAALTAKQRFGAIYGQAEGLQGQSFGVVTKDLSKGERSVSLTDIGKGLYNMITFAKQNKDKLLFVTKLGSSLAGYSVDQMRDLFNRLNSEVGIPDNVILPREYEMRNAHLNDNSTFTAVVTKSGRLLSSLQITEAEWNRLTKEEQDKIIDCN